MTVRLNLTMDEVVARKIKSYAARKKTSVSQIVEEQLEEVLKTEKISAEKNQSEEDNSFKRFLEKYAENIKGGLDYEKAQDEYLRKKHGF